MGAGLKRARAAVRATQLRWWTSGDGLHWWLQVAPGKDEPVGEVKFCTDNSGKAPSWWYAAARGKTVGIYATCRAAKLAVRRAVRG